MSRRQKRVNADPIVVEEDAQNHVTHEEPSLSISKPDVPMELLVWKERVYQSAQQYCKRVFGVEARTLALFRMSIAAITLVDLLSRIPFVEVFYSDDGVWPRSLQIADNGHRAYLIFHSISGLYWVQMCIFIFHICCQFALLVGYRTRLSNILCLLLLNSLHQRHPVVKTAGETLIRVMHLWGLFLPLEAAYSWDTWTPQRTKTETSDAYENDKDKEIRQVAASRSPSYRWIVCAGSAAVQIQVALMYIFSSFYKRQPEWTETFVAVESALGSGWYSHYLGLFLLRFPALCKLLTRSVVYWELLGPLLWFSPWFTSYCRGFATLGFFGLHLGFLFTMEIGLFPWDCFAALVIFLPPSVIDRCLLHMKRLLDWFQRILDCRVTLKAFICYLYNLIIFYKSRSPRVNPSIYTYPTRTVNRFAAVFLAVIIWYNGIVLCTYYPQLSVCPIISLGLSTSTLTPYLYPLTEITGAEQVRSMFTHSTSDLWSWRGWQGGYWVIPTGLRNGQFIDLMKVLNGETEASYGNYSNLDLDWKPYPVPIVRQKFWNSYLQDLKGRYSNSGKTSAHLQYKAFISHLRTQWDKQHGEADRILWSTLFLVEYMVDSANRTEPILPALAFYDDKCYDIKVALYYASDYFNSLPAQSGGLLDYGGVYRCTENGDKMKEGASIKYWP